MADDNSNKYKLAAEEEFDHFVKQCDTTENWIVAHDKDGVKVWYQKHPTEYINIVKLYTEFADIPPVVLYDVLHDPEYRTVWDEAMIEGFLIEQLDKCNDVGYYSAKSPVSLVSNRDFVNQRSWRMKEDKEYVIFNHSVPHVKMPEKRGFVRARSILTGYLVRARDGGGCSLTYLTQTDPKGMIPAWVTNSVTTSFAPKIVTKLKNAALGYDAWKKDHEPDRKPWRIFDKSSK
jgi:hypothetical protein